MRRNVEKFSFKKRRRKGVTETVVKDTDEERSKMDNGDFMNGVTWIEMGHSGIE